MIKEIFPIQRILCSILGLTFKSLKDKLDNIDQFNRTKKNL